MSSRSFRMLHLWKWYSFPNEIRYKILINRVTVSRSHNTYLMFRNYSREINKRGWNTKVLTVRELTNLGAGEIVHTLASGN